MGTGEKRQRREEAAAALAALRQGAEPCTPRKQIVAFDVNNSEERLGALRACALAASPAFLASVEDKSVTSTAATGAINRATTMSVHELKQDQVYPELLAFIEPLVCGNTDEVQGKRISAAVLTANSCISHAAAMANGSHQTDVWQAVQGAQANAMTNSKQVMDIGHSTGCTSSYDFDRRRKIKEAEVVVKQKYHPQDVQTILSGKLQKKDALWGEQPAAVQQQCERPGPIGGDQVPECTEVPMIASSAVTTAEQLVEMGTRLARTVGDPAKLMVLIADNNQHHRRWTSRASISNPFSIAVQCMRASLQYDSISLNGKPLHKTKTSELVRPVALSDPWPGEEAKDVRRRVLQGHLDDFAAHSCRALQHGESEAEGGGTRSAAEHTRYVREFWA
jgi:hypothetical protein